MMFKQFPITRSFILFTALVGTAGISNAAYVAPVGIPTPTFCVDSVAPSTPAAWPGNEVTGYYYIDNTHPNATNSGNTYGYPDKPRSSIPSTYAAGDYAEIHGGPYTGSNITIVSNGTSANPVWIRGSSATTKPTIRQYLKLRGSYLNVENLFFDTSRKTMGVSAGTGKTEYVCLRNNEISGSNIADANTAALSVSGASGNLTSNVVIYNNLIHDLGNNDRTIPENDYHGILPGQYSEYVWVLNNHIYNMGGDAIQVGQATYSAAQRPNYIYIGSNLFHDDRENAVDIKRANEVIVSRNEMYGYATSTSSSGAVVIIHNGTDNVWILSNTVYDGNLGIVTTQSTNTYFIGNTISNIHYPAGSTSWNPNSGYSSGAAIHFRGSGTTGGAIHNTIYNYDIGIQLTQGGAVGYDIQNNILSERAQPTGWDIKVGESDVASGSTFDYNLIYQPNGDARIGWNNTTPDNVAMFNLSTGKCANCPGNIDPQFIAPSTRNFKVKGGSPAMNSGTNHPLFSTFNARYGLEIREDIIGNPRVLGPNPEIGAYELMPPATVTNPQATLLPQ